MTSIRKVVCFTLLVQLFHSTCLAQTTSTKPHIIIIMADDMGYNDVGFHGSDQIPTPNIDALATFGIALNRYYVAPMCTPSRSSLMTGKYPSHIGMQQYVIPSAAPYGLGLDQKLLPEYMHDGGYRTHIIGKWHLGFYQKRYTPTQRGFDSHFGYLGPYIDYYNYSLTYQYPGDSRAENGYDMRSNLSMHYDSKGTYATDLFTQVAVDTIDQHPKHLPMFMYIPHLAPHAANNYDPMQAPADELTQFAYIADEKRRKYAAMMSRLDAGVGRVVEALQSNGMLQNSVILFFSDNGAPVVGMHSNDGSNFPLRGQKDSAWEGAIRSAGAIWSPLLKKRQRTSKQLFHISDWLPTFAHLAGVKVPQPIDGHNIWAALSQDVSSPRSKVLGHMDAVTGFSSLLYDEWKYLNGTTLDGKYDGWLKEAAATNERHPSFDAYGDAVLQSPTGRAFLPFSFSLTEGYVGKLTAKQAEQLRDGSAVRNCGTSPQPDVDDERWTCRPLLASCLFNIVDDPCERRNLAALRPDLMADMKVTLDAFALSAVKPRSMPDDGRSKPSNFNQTWTWWYDELGMQDHDDGGGAGRNMVGSYLLIVIGGIIMWMV